MAVAPSGHVYLAEALFGTLRVVEPNGVIARLGTGTCFSEGGIEIEFEPGPVDLGAVGLGLGLAPVQASVFCLDNLTVMPDGSLLAADPQAGLVRRLRAALPALSVSDQVIASEDGSEVYVFSAAGRHLETRDALTNTVQLAFAYDGAGRLVTVTDADGNVTTIERDGQGAPTAILAPFGQRTELTLDGNGYLASLTNPADETVTLQYTAGGLLTRLINPRGDTTRFVYDEDGLLERDEDAVGGFLELVRAAAADSFTVALSSAEGRTTTYGVAHRAAEEEGRTTTTAAGLTVLSAKKPDAGKGTTTTTTTAPDGTTTLVRTRRDARFVTAEVLDSMEVRTPGGLISVVKAARVVTLSDSANPFSLVTQTDTLRVNGRTFLNVFNAQTRTFSATTPEGRTSSGLVDSLGRVIAEVVPCSWAEPRMSCST